MSRSEIMKKNLDLWESLFSLSLSRFLLKKVSIYSQCLRKNIPIINESKNFLYIECFANYA